MNENSPKLPPLFSEFLAALKERRTPLLRGVFVLGGLGALAFTLAFIFREPKTKTETVPLGHEYAASDTSVMGEEKALRKSLRDIFHTTATQTAYLCLRQDLFSGWPFEGSLSLLGALLKGRELPRKAREALAVIKRLGEEDSVWNLSQIQLAFKEAFSAIPAQAPEAKGFWSFLGSFAKLKPSGEGGPPYAEKMKNLLALLRKGRVEEVYNTLQKMETPQEVSAQRCLKQMHRFLAAQKAIHVLDRFFTASPLLEFEEELP